MRKYLLVSIFILALTLNSWATINWMGAHTKSSQPNDSQTIHFYVEMYDSYSGCHAEVLINEGGVWKSYTLTQGANNVANSTWSADVVVKSNATLYYFHGWDDWGANVYDSNGGSNYSISINPTTKGDGNGNWNDSGNWCDGSVPSSSSATFIIAHNLTLNQNVIVGSLTINSGKTFTASYETPKTLTISSGGTLTNNGTFTASNGTVAFAGAGTVAGTVVFNNVTIVGGVNFGSGSTINGTLTINSGGWVNTNAPTYASSSTLKYNSGETYGRGIEWSAISGTGYPYNLQISNNTILNIGANSGTGTARQIAGNLTIDVGSTFSMSVNPMTAAVTIVGNVLNNGTIVLSSSIGGDLKVEGNFNDNNNFTANGRAVFFQGGNSQNISSTTDPLEIDVMRITKSAGEVIMGQNLLVDETADPLQFNTSTSVLNLNGKKLTIGKTDVSSSITMILGSMIKGSPSSSLEILGNGNLGTLNFDQTTPGTTNAISSFSFNRPTDGSVTIGNNLVVGDLTISSGNLTLGESLGIWGNFVNNGSFTSNSQAVTFTGSSKTISGTSTTTFYDLTIGADASISIAEDAKVTVNNGLTVSSGSKGAGTITINSGSSGTGSLITNGTVSGNVTVQRHMTNDQHWQYISSPVNLTGTTFDGSFGTNDPTELFRWDEDYSFNSITGYWINIRTSSEWNSNSFVPGIGYTLSYYSEVKTNPYSLTGEPYNTTQTVTLTKTTGSTGEGWNLVGNPFPCTLAGNFNADGTNNFMSQNASHLNDTYEAMYFWNESANDYVAINNSSSATYIDNGRAFMVCAASNNASLSFNTNIRKHADNTIYKAKDETTRFNLAVKSDDGLFNEIQFSFGDGMTYGLDPSYDAGKYQGNPDIAFYSFLPEPNASKFEIQALPVLTEALSVPLGLKVSQPGNYVFSVTKNENIESGTPITIEDKHTGTQVDLTINPEYYFSIAEARTYDDRFVLHFKSGVGIGESTNTIHPLTFYTPNTLTIKNLQPGSYQITVSDIAGRRVTAKQVTTDGSVEMPLSLQTGIYIVEVFSETSKFANKIFIK